MICQVEPQEICLCHLWFLYEIMNSLSVSSKTCRLHFAYAVLSHCFSLKQTFLKLNKQVSVICAALFLSIQALVSRLDLTQKSNLWGRGHFWQSQQQRSMIVWGKWCKSRCLEDRNYPVLRSYFHKLDAVQMLVARELVWWSRDNPALMDSDSTRNPSGVKGIAVTLLFVKCSLYWFCLVG